ncbi:MAG: hypothetical protein OHK93_002033 [Ramalina farinacea]|uniref:Uncharacterized protein n=1 Tax=Ramalina farinacea TaxID=258253 RepID=A0AA43QQL4_9LECA|nr:hypothetical protein [Ramalina farinacea]
MNTVTAFLSLLALLKDTHALPTTDVTAKYDDLPSTQPSTNPPNSYDGLGYSEWDIASSPAIQIGGVVGPSAPNRIIAGFNTEAPGTAPSLTVLSPYTSFRFLDFYFGCATRTDEGTANLATECTITVSGFTKAGDSTASTTATFEFQPPLVEVAPVNMTHAVLPSAFQNMDLQEVTVLPNAPEVNGLLMDNVHYSLK